jgi:hypothetical protein
VKFKPQQQVQLTQPGVLAVSTVAESDRGTEIVVVLRQHPEKTGWVIVYHGGKEYEVSERSLIPLRPGEGIE